MRPKKPVSKSLTQSMVEACYCAIAEAHGRQFSVSSRRETGNMNDAVVFPNNTVG